MTPRFLIYLLAVILCVLWALWHFNKSTQPKQLSTQAETTSLIPNTNEENRLQWSNQTVSSPAEVPTAIASSNSQSRVDQIKADLERKNAPIDFYGQIIDQDSNALSGVKMHIYVRHWELTSSSFTKPVYLDAESDSSGRFEIGGITGDGFSLESIQKDGYDAEPGQRSFGPAGSSYESSVIFKMWSTNIHEALITGNKSFEIIPDGRPYYINLTDSTIAESGTGGLKVWIQYTNQIKDSQLYDWSAGIDVINGGLQDAADSPMWTAPTSGYVPSYVNTGQIKGYQRGDTEERHFYLQLKNGQEYGK